MKTFVGSSAMVLSVAVLLLVKQGLAAPVSSASEIAPDDRLVCFCAGDKVQTVLCPANAPLDVKFCTRSSNLSWGQDGETDGYVLIFYFSAPFLALTAVAALIAVCFAVYGCVEGCCVENQEEKIKVAVVKKGKSLGVHEENMKDAKMTKVAVVMKEKHIFLIEPKSIEGRFYNA